MGTRGPFHGWAFPITSLHKSKFELNKNTTNRDLDVHFPLGVFEMKTRTRKEKIHTRQGNILLKL